jgi:diguanylate cyclase (GGDEF)-like protein
MVKPFSPPELIARIEMLDRRSTLSLDANPLTRLPGNISINKEIEKKLNQQEKFAVLYFDLDNFKALNDYYGFDRGDEVIKEFSNILVSASQKKGTNQDFIGHVGGDDFVIITTIEQAEIIAKDVISQFDKKTPQFYDEKDRMKGFIETKDRTGNIKNFPFVTVSIGIITNRYRHFSHVAQISSVGAELKEVAKKDPKSNYVFDRRDSAKEQNNSE